MPAKPYLEGSLVFRASSMTAQASGRRFALYRGSKTFSDEEIQ